MPKMVLNRNFRLASINGPIILFEKDKEVNVPFPMYQEALYIGATVVEGETAPEIPAPKVKETPKGAARDAAVMDALELMYSRNERGDFGGNGAPTVKALSQICEFDVQAKERDVYWATFQEKINDD